MTEYTGVLENISAKPRTIKRGPRTGQTTTAYSICVDGNWYSAGFDAPPANQGDTVTFQADETQWGMQIKKGTLRVSGAAGGAAPTPPWEGSPAPAAPRSAPPKPAGRTFPVGLTDHSRSIIRQNALGHATEVVTTFAPDDAQDLDKQAEEVIRIARKFEAYSAGDIEREQAEAIVHGED